jgi:hypothetical protein
MTQYVRFIFIIGSCVALFGSCGNEKKETPPSQNPPRVENQKPSKLHCTVLFSGIAPKMNMIKMNADTKCLKLHTQPVYFQNTMVNDKGLLQNVFVYIKDGLTGKAYPVPNKPVVIDQQGCMYHPHVFGIQVNQPLRIENSDPVLHNIHAIPKINKGFNIAQPLKGMKSDVAFTVPEIMVRVKCDVHSWMGCYIGVLDHPFYAVTDSNGACDITGLPPGEYQVSAWHEELGSVEQKVSVKEGIVENIEFTFAAKK